MNQLTNIHQILQNKEQSSNYNDESQGPLKLFQHTYKERNQWQKGCLDRLVGKQNPSIYLLANETESDYESDIFIGWTCQHSALVGWWAWVLNNLSSNKGMSCPL